MKSWFTCCAVIFLLGLLFLNSKVLAQDSGLIAEDYKHIKVSVRQMTKDGKKLGLSVDSVQSEVESQLRKHDLIPTDKPKLEGLNIMVIVSSNAYSIEIAFERMMSYYCKGKTYYINAKAWHAGSTGTHGGNAAPILQILEKKLNIFIAQYVADNEKVLSFSNE